MNWSIEQKTRATFIIVILFVVSIGFFAYRNTLNIISSNQAGLNIRQVLDDLQSTLSTVLDVQDGQLDYLVTGDANSLQQTNAAHSQITQRLTDISSITGDDSEQQGRLNQLTGLITQWFTQIDQAITLQQTSGVDAARTFVLGSQMKSTLAEIRTVLNAMTQDEQDQLTQNRSIQSTQRAQTTLATFGILTAVMVILLTYGYFVIHHDLVKRRRLEQLLKDERTLLRTLIDAIPDFIFVKDAQLRFILTNRAMAQLLGAATSDEVIGKSDSDFFPQAQVVHYAADEKGILQSGQALVDREEPTTSSGGEEKVMLTTKVPMHNSAGEITQLVGISHDITSRKRAEQEIELLNQNLRRQAAEVETTNHALETANHELEAFSYSVSHDLRAPLRAINGFSRILLEDYEADLVPEAQRYLQKVLTNGEHMGELIDDLLRFSRLSRQPISKQTVEPAALIQQVLDEELRADCENRQIEIIVGELPSCEADPILLRQVFVNLLGNAIKFTGKRDCARIEVGTQQNNGSVVYFVRDNGAGFDARYADKLFGVFQRLHRAEDFLGTGVGLAIVQRVILRHGGKIWAEGAVDKGATFYFTIGGTHE